MYSAVTSHMMRHHNDLEGRVVSRWLNGIIPYFQLENENRHLRRLLGESVAPEITESLRSDVDGYLMKAKLENEKVQSTIIADPQAQT